MATDRNHAARKGIEMKGQWILDSLLYTLEVQGESWQQQWPLQGLLTITNKSNETKDLSAMGVILAWRKFKDVHQNSQETLKATEKWMFAQGTLCLPQESKTLTFATHFDVNAPITDKKGSYYLCYGPKGVGQQLQIILHPFQLFTQIGQCLEQFFRFRPKELKAHTGGVTQYKYQAPEAKDFAHVDALELGMSMVGDKKEELLLDFLFQVKTFDVGSVLSKVTKGKKHIQFKLTPKEYSFGKGHLHQEKILEILGEAIKQVKLKW